MSIDVLKLKLVRWQKCMSCLVCKQSFLQLNTTFSVEHFERNFQTETYKSIPPQTSSDFIKLNRPPSFSCRLLQPKRTTKCQFGKLHRMCNACNVADLWPRPSRSCSTSTPRVVVAGWLSRSNCSSTCCLLKMWIMLKQPPQLKLCQQVATCKNSRIGEGKTILPFLMILYTCSADPDQNRQNRC